VYYRWIHPQVAEGRLRQIDPETVYSTAFRMLLPSRPERRAVEVAAACDQNPNYGGKRSRELSGNDDSTGYVAVALPVGSLAGEEGVVRRRLHVAIDVERPRRDFVLARGGRPPVEPPEPPGVAT
jgi:hypothetical protein